MIAGESASARLRQVERELTGVRESLAERAAYAEDRDAEIAGMRTRNRQLRVALRAALEDNVALQKALAASQADVTTKEQQRDKFIAAADKLHGEWLDLKAELAEMREARDCVRESLRIAEQQRDLERAEVASRQGLCDQLMELLGHLTDQAMADGWTRVAERMDRWAANGYAGSWQDAQYDPPDGAS